MSPEGRQIVILSPFQGLVYSQSNPGVRSAHPRLLSFGPPGLSPLDCMYLRT